MDRDRFSFIAHSSHAVCNPIGEAKIDQALGLLGLGPESRFIDIGAGKGEVAARVCERSGAAGVAVERSVLMAQECRRRAAGLQRGSLEVVERDAVDALRGPAGFDAALCIGSSHALGDLRHALRALGACLKPGGLVLIGEGYWKRQPDPAYLQALHAAAADSTTHAGTITLLADAGFLPLWAWTASEDEWDAYEWRYAWNVEAWASAHPDDPDRDAMLARSRSWREVAQRWGRDTLGFGLYLARLR